MKFWINISIPTPTPTPTPSPTPTPTPTPSPAQITYMSSRTTQFFVESSGWLKIQLILNKLLLFHLTRITILGTGAKWLSALEDREVQPSKL